jgi:HEAT repeat protein
MHRLTTFWISTHTVHRAIVCLAAMLTCAGGAWADDDAGGELVDLVIGLLGDADPDLRALGLDQVRTAAPGEAATLRFAEQLAKLPAGAQAALLGALADRGDTAARPAVIDRLEASQDMPVRLAAIEALGVLGEAADTARLVELLSSDSADEHAAARASLQRLPGEGVSPAIVAGLASAPSGLRVTLIEILSERRAFDAVPDILPAAVDSDPAVRAAAMTALGELAGPDHIAGMLQGVLRAEAGAERAAAEKCVMFVCQRIEDRERRAEPILAAMDGLPAADRLALLATLGRVGGSAALVVLEGAMADAHAETHDTGLRALCLWPEASIAPRLTELVQAEEHEEHRALALRALIRVAPLPDDRSDAERLELLQSALALCQDDELRNYALSRARAIRIVETLRFLLPYLDEPALAQAACESIVELAHHRGLREPNKAEFHAALDRVIATSQDDVVIDRAQRYQRNETWVRPAAPKSR